MLSNFVRATNDATTALNRQPICCYLLPVLWMMSYVEIARIYSSSLDFSEIVANTPLGTSLTLKITLKAARFRRPVFFSYLNGRFSQFYFLAARQTCREGLYISRIFHAGCLRNNKLVYTTFKKLLKSTHIVIHMYLKCMFC